MPETTPEIVFPVRTWADYCRESEDARPVIEETSEIPAAVAPDFDDLITPHVPITPAEFARRMYAIEDEHPDLRDEELDHIAADALMVEVLRSLGYGEGCDVFEKMPKCYS